jgi:hypothetical protein
MNRCRIIGRGQSSIRLSQVDVMVDKSLGVEILRLEASEVTGLLCVF